MKLSEIRALVRSRGLRLDKTMGGNLFAFCPRTGESRTVDGVIGWRKSGGTYVAY